MDKVLYITQCMVAACDALISTEVNWITFDRLIIELDEWHRRRLLRPGLQGKPAGSAYMDKAVIEQLRSH